MAFSALPLFLIECYLMARARNTRSRHTSSLPCTHGDLAPLPQDLPVKPESPSFLRPSTSSFFFPHQNNTNRATGYPLFTWNSASLNSKISFFFFWKISSSAVCVCFFFFIKDIYFVVNLMGIEREFYVQIINC